MVNAYEVNELMDCTRTGRRSGVWTFHRFRRLESLRILQPPLRSIKPREKQAVLCPGGKERTVATRIRYLANDAPRV